MKRIKNGKIGKNVKTEGSNADHESQKGNNLLIYKSG